MLVALAVMPLVAAGMAVAVVLLALLAAVSLVALAVVHQTVDMVAVAALTVDRQLAVQTDLAQLAVRAALALLAALMVAQGRPAPQMPPLAQLEQARAVAVDLQIPLEALEEMALQQVIGHKHLIVRPQAQEVVVVEVLAQLELALAAAFTEEVAAL